MSDTDRGPSATELHERATRYATPLIRQGDKQGEGRNLGVPPPAPVVAIDDLFPILQDNGRSPCFVMCGKPICRDHGCLHVYKSPSAA